MTTTRFTADDLVALGRLSVEAELLGWTLPELLADLRTRLQRPGQVRLWRYIRPDVALLERVLLEVSP